MAIHEEEIRYVCDDLPMLCYLYRGDGQNQNQPRPGVLVFPGASGLSTWCRGGARKLAEEGYVTLACDYYGNAFFDGSFTSTETKARYEDIISDVSKKRRRAKAAFDALLARPEVDKTKIASMGYCFGGAMSLELAMSGAPLAAVIGFHTSFLGISWADVDNIHGRVLICNGSDDPIAPPEERIAFEMAMKGDGLRWQISVYGGVLHSFTDPDANIEWARYDRFADQESWNAMRFLLKDVFETGGQTQ